MTHFADALLRTHFFLGRGAKFSNLFKNFFLKITKNVKKNQILKKLKIRSFFGKIAQIINFA